MSNRKALEKVDFSIKRLKLLSKDSKYIVALSGGADSVALLLMILELGYRVEAAHCNFNLRGKESERDEEFVRNLASRLGIKLHIIGFNTREYAAKWKLSIETAARNLRYDYFEKLRIERKAAGILVAHHRDDNVETVLMNLTRGTGINGLSGISYKNGFILRPLLCLSRKEIEEYLSEKDQDYVTDSTNLETEATRNKFRLSVIPMLETINPNASAAIDLASRHLDEAKEIVEWTVRKAKENIISHPEPFCLEISKKKLMEWPSPKYILSSICMELGFNPTQTEEIYEAIGGIPGKTFYSDENELITDRETVIICSRTVTYVPLAIEGCGTYKLDSQGVGGKLTVSLMETNNPEFSISRERSKVCLDAEKLTFPLTLRHTTEGDRFQPFGMKGSKLVSDYLTDKKKNVLEKRGQLAIISSNGHIAWLVDERPSERFKITSQTTKAIIIEHIK